VSQGADQDHTIEPIAYTSSRDEDRELLTKVMATMGRSTNTKKRPPQGALFLNQ